MKTLKGNSRTTRFNKETHMFELENFEAGINNDQVFWSSADSGFASYVLEAFSVEPTTYKGRYWVTASGETVRLVSVNGCGEERWDVHSDRYTFSRCDTQAVEYFGLKKP